MTEKFVLDQVNGIHCHLLIPIFASPTHHGYDTIDYFKINPVVGDIDDFSELVESIPVEYEGHFGFVANHCSNQSSYFMDAIRDINSPYHHWFVWKEWL